MAISGQSENGPIRALIALGLLAPGLAIHFKVVVEWLDVSAKEFALIVLFQFLLGIISFGLLAVVAMLALWSK